MNIVMMTNTYAPHIGGVAKSVEAFAAEYRRHGHRVLIVCPEFDGAPAREEQVIRIPAIRHFNRSDFSLVLRAPRSLREAVEDFHPDIVHSHHPFLLGASAVRLARMLGVPLAFTHHTMYEHYTHYGLGESETVRQFVKNLSTNYANLSGAVFAPSASVADILRNRGVTVPVHVVPTGVRIEEFEAGSGRAFREIMGIPRDAFVVGHVGRLAPEKNLDFLARALMPVVKTDRSVHALIVGGGSSLAEMRMRFAASGLESRAHFPGPMAGALLASVYKAMDVFAFASLSETQGMVLAEAMAAGTPVVALDAPGVREVVRDGVNGRLLDRPDEIAFMRALLWLKARSPEDRKVVRDAARQTAEAFALARSTAAALEVYRALMKRPRTASREADAAWNRTLRLLRSEWDLLTGMADAALSRSGANTEEPVVSATRLPGDAAWPPRQIGRGEELRSE